MADHADAAAELQEIAIQIALERHQARPGTKDTESAVWCEECDEVIPHKRRELIPGVRYCVQCASDLELRQKRGLA